MVHSNQHVTVYLTRSTGNNGEEIEFRCVSRSFSPVEYSVINWSVLITSIDDGNSRPYLKPVAGDYVGPAVHRQKMQVAGVSTLRYLSNPSVN